MRPILTAILVFIAIQCEFVKPASAQSCTAAVAVNFGTINLTSGGSAAISGTVAVTCTGTPGATIRACPGIGSPRLMTRSSGGQIAYGLYTDSGHSSVWGSTVGGPYPPPVDVIIGAGGSGNSGTTIFALIEAGQSSAPTTNLNPNYSQAPAILVGAADAASNPTCADIGAANATAGSASIQATYQPACTIAANPMAFGNLASTASAINQSTTIQTHCSADTPFTMSLNGGLTAASDPTAREMQHGADRLRYGLYQDSARLQPWGSTIGINVLTSTGNGASVAIPVYGRIHPQTTPPVGVYSDTVIVTIEY
jgi:spore coat protein U-like protein